MRALLIAFVWTLSSAVLGQEAAPHTGSFGDWLRLDRAEVLPATVGGQPLDRVAFYTVHFDVTNHRDGSLFSNDKERSGMIGVQDPGWIFCGYRLDIISRFGENSAGVYAISPTGFAFSMKARLHPIEQAKAGIEGNLQYRYVPTSSISDQSICKSDGYSMSDIYYGRE